MITGLVILHLLTHEIPVLCCAIYGCYRYFKRRDAHVCCDHVEEN